LRTPYVEHMSFSIQRQLAKDWVLEASYTGQIGIKLLGHNFFNAARNINSPLTGAPPSTGNINDRVAYEPGIISAQSRELCNCYRSWYHALNIRLDKRLSHGFTISAGYTLSKDITNQTDIGVGLISDVPDPFNLRIGEGPAIFDHRHVLAISWVWSPEPRFSNRWLNGIAGGWTITGLHRFQSGSPLTFLAGTDIAANGQSGAATSQYAELKPGVTAANLQISHPNTASMINQYFNTAAFVPLSQIPVGTYGNAARGLVYGPSYYDSDVAVLRYIPVGTERIKAQLRGEFFNVFNHPNFDNPTSPLSSNTFGRILAAEPGRVAQLALKLVW
jgi:hypothetical protein